MITIICGTNRPGSNSSKVAGAYMQLLEKKEVNSQLLSMSDLAPDFVFKDAVGLNSDIFQQQLREFIFSVDKYVIIAPEYNGSIPGVLKAFIDCINPKHIPGKKAALVGVSSGRAGNLRGLDHLTNILNYMGVAVLPNKIPVSRIRDLIDKDGILSDEETLRTLDKQAEELLRF